MAHKHRIIKGNSYSIQAEDQGNMTKAVYDPDEDGDIAEAQLQLNFATHSNASDHTQNADTDLDATFEASLKNTDNHTSGTTNKVFTATEQEKLGGVETGATKYPDTGEQVFTDTQATKLAGIADGAEVNVNADWNAGSGDAQILNKPTLGTAAAAATTDFAPALGADDNYVNDAEKIVIGNTSGTNTGDNVEVAAQAIGFTITKGTIPKTLTVALDANVAGTNTGDQTAIPNSALANMIQKTYKGRTTASTGSPEDVGVATLKTDLGLVKGDVGLGNVDNTSDLNKPISTATQSALDGKQASLGFTPENSANKGAISGYAPLGANQLVPVANLASGTPDGTKFIRDDGTLQSPGASSTNIKQTEVDFGTTPISEKSFLITDTDVQATSQLLGSVAYEAPTGKDLDELEFDGFDLKFAPGVGQFTLYATALDNAYVADTFKINYLIG